MILTLIGFMGSGKSSVGRLLAEELSFTFVDMDDFIEEMTGRKIREIFREDGEEVFRKMETKALSTLLGLDGSLVLATGGGVVTREENRNLLKKSDYIIYLRTGMETIKNRLKNDDSRPLLQGENRDGKIAHLFDERLATYENLFTHVVDTDSLSVLEVVEVCRGFLQKSFSRRL